MNFIEKLRVLEKSLAAERGDFVLYALIRRQDAPNRWDLLLSAAWFGEDEKETLDFIVGKIKEKLTPQEMIMLSRIVLFPPDDPRVREISQKLQEPVMHGNVELSRWTFSDMPVSHAHIVTST